MDKAKTLGVVRHLLTFGAGFLVAQGFLEAGDVEAVVGAVTLLLGVGWSIFDKRAQ